MLHTVSTNCMFYCINGNLTCAVVPLSGSEIKSSEPLCSFTMLYVMYKPNPVPSPGFLVVKNGSVMFGRFSLEIPEPVSEIATTNCWFSMLVFKVISPLPSMACTAFGSRLMKT